MKSKVKKRCKQMLTGLLALSMLCGLLPQNTVSVSAATTAKTNVSSYGRLGNVDVGSKTKTGTWWKINVGSKTAFCLSLGKTCHTGNTYQVTDTHTWNQNTGGEKHGYYAKIIRFYVNDCNRAKKGFVLGQALIWAVSEGNTSEARDIYITLTQHQGIESTALCHDRLSLRSLVPEQRFLYISSLLFPPAPASVWT